MGKHRMPRAAADEVAGDFETWAGEADQSASDADQTGSDEDGAASERDDADANSDQQAADRDQAVADRQAKDGPTRFGLQVLEASRAEREKNTIRRLFTHISRAANTRSRFETADRRDTMSARRDATAQRRDLRAEVAENAIVSSEATLIEKFERVRARAAADRARAAADRARAAADRERAAQDRAEAARDRARLETELRTAHLDDLTGAFRREMGKRALSHEIDRAVRADGRFVVAFVDVDGMKSVNDRDGHAAGDHVLKTLVWTMRSKLRSFDPVVRYGGDEFVCGIGGVELDEVERRFEAIGRSVRDDVGVGISVGLAELEPDDTLDRITARADAALLDAKRRHLGRVDSRSANTGLTVERAGGVTEEERDGSSKG